MTLTDAVAAALKQCCAERPPFEEMIQRGRDAIIQAVDEGLDLDAMWLESDADKRLPGKYRRHQVHNDPEWGFTVVVLLWEPGATTPIHDHDTWCVFAALRGEMEVTNYEVIGNDEGQPLRLRECGREQISAFAVGDNAAAETEVHRVRNIGTERAISLHVYGDDLTQRTLFNGRGIRIEGKTGCMAFQTGGSAY